MTIDAGLIAALAGFALIAFIVGCAVWAASIGFGTWSGQPPPRDRPADEHGEQPRSGKSRRGPQ